MARLTRREWHRLTLGGVATAAAGILPGTARRTVSAQSESRFAGVLIGLQSYSFRDLSLDDGIAAMQQVGITSCELWEGHVEPAELRRPENRERLRRWRTTIPLDWFEEIRWQFEDAGIENSTPTTSASRTTSRTRRSTAASRWRRCWGRRPSRPRRT